MRKDINTIIPFEERKEISEHFHTQTKELQNIRRELSQSIPTNTLWSIIIETKEKGLTMYNEIIKRHGLKTKSRIGSKIKRITKAVLCFYQREKIDKNTSDNIKTILNEEEDTNNQEAEKINQEKRAVGINIKNYLWAKDKKPFWIFKTYFLERKKEWWNFHESSDYAIKKVCEIYRRENNEEIQELFKDRARGNNYLKEKDDNED